MAKINGKLGIDENLLGTEADDIIKGFDGDDTITPGAGNDIITGGTGNNTINIDLKTCKEQGLTFGDDIVNLTKGEKLTLNIIAEEDPTNPNAVNIGNYAIKTNGKDYTIAFYQSSNLIQDESGNYVENTDDIIGSITFKNFAAKDVLGAEGSLIIKVNDFEMDLVKEIYTIGQNSFESTMVNYDTIFNNGWVKTGVIKGSRLSENINVSEYEGIGKKAGKGVTINAGAGNDNITGSKYDDKITGGVGNNTINVSLNGKFGDDTIVLTKNENLVINVTGDGQYTWDNYRTSVDGKDFVVKFYSESWQKEDSYLGSIRIKDFAAKNGVGENGSVVLKAGALTYDLTKEIFDLSIGGEAIDTSNIRMAEYGTIEGQVNTSWVKKGVINGSRLGETFTASGVKDAYDKKGTKGVTINAGGGDDIIAGSKYDDKITGGVGDNTINVSLNGQFGDDTIVLTKNENLVINVSDAGKYGENFLRQYATTVEGKDFIVKFYGEPRDLENGSYNEESYLGSIRIKDFAAKNGVGENGSVVINIPELGTRFDLTDEIFTIAGVNDTRSKMVLYSNDEGITSWVKKGTINGTRLGEDFWAADITEGYGKNKDKGVTINAGGGDDRATGSDFADKIYGGDGDDILDGYKGNDILNGGKGNDDLCADEGDDILIGGDGNDILKGGAGNDVITGGTGKNTIIHFAGGGNDIINLTKGEQLTLEVTGVSELADLEIKLSDNKKDVLVYTSETEYITIKNLGSKDVTNDSSKKKPEDDSTVMIKVNGVEKDLRDYVYSRTVDKNYTGTYLNENINASATYLTKKVKKEVVEKELTDKGLSLNGGKGDDIITGSKYSDTIKGGDGDDVLAGGTGNDKLYGEAGDNTYVFGLGAGNDTVYAGKGEDTVKFEFSADEINSIEQALTSKGKGTKDLVISYGDNGDTVTIKNYFTIDKNGEITGVKSAVTKIETSEGTFDLEEVRETGYFTVYNEDGSNTIYGGKGNDIIRDSAFGDTIYGGIGNDTVILSTGDDYVEAGDGNDTISGLDSITTGDKTVDGGAGDDFIDLKLAIGQNYLIGGEGNDTIFGGKDYDCIEGGVGDDIINGEAGDDYLIGNFGADTINGGDGDDIIIASTYLGSSKPAGVNTVTDYSSYFLADKNAKTIDGGAGNDVIWGSNGADTIKGGDGNDKVYAFGEGSVIDLGNGDDITNLYQNTAKTLYAGAGNDTVSIEYGKATVTGGTGDDALWGGYVSDSTFKFAAGDGNDKYRYRGYTTSSGNGTPSFCSDTLVFENISSADMTFAKDGENLVITYADNSSVALERFFKEGVDSANWNVYVQTTEGKVLLSGMTGLQNLLLKLATPEGAVAGTVGDDTIKAEATGSVIYGYQGNDTINISGAESTIFGGQGDDVINTSGAESTIVGGEGDDVINTMRYAVDNFVFNNGDGHDVINQNVDTLPQQFATTKTDNISLTGVDKDGFTAAINGKDVVISYNDGKDSVTIKDYLLNADNTRDFVITTKDGETTSLNDVLNAILKSEVSADATVGTVGADEITETTAKSEIYGFYGNDTINTSGGESTIVGGQGDDVINTMRYAVDNFVFNNGDGHDVINQNVDTLPQQFATTKTDNIKLTGVDKDGFTAEIDGNDVIISYNNGTDSVTIKDYLLNADNTRDFVITTNDDVETSLNDILNAQLVAQTAEGAFAGTVGADEIIVDTDGTKAYGYYGDDVMTITGTSSYLYGGTGNDTLTGGAGDDKLYGQAGDDKLYGGAGLDYINAGAGNDYIEGGDDKDSLNGGDGNDTIYGGTGDDLIGNSASEAGDDEFHGGDGVDTIYGGAGNDTLYGDAGNDKIYGNRGDDTIYGGEGNDIIYGENNSNDAGTGKNYIDAGAGDDNVYGGAGDDIIILGEGNNDASGYDGDDKIYGGNGNDDIYTGHGNNYVETGDGTDYAICGSGNDTIILGAGTKTVTSAKGDDVITLTKSIAETKVTVKDSEGNDTINLADNKDNVNVVFNIDTEGNMDYDGVRLIADSDVDSWKTNFSTIGGIKLTTDTTDIETITTADGYQLTATDINTLKENVASWLTADGRSYSDVGAVLSSGNDTDIAALMAQFENAGWEQQSV